MRIWPSIKAMEGVLNSMDRRMGEEDEVVEQHIADAPSAMEFAEYVARNCVIIDTLREQSRIIGELCQQGAMSAQLNREAIAALQADRDRMERELRVATDTLDEMRTHYTGWRQRAERAEKLHSLLAELVAGIRTPL